MNLLTLLGRVPICRSLALFYIWINATISDFQGDVIPTVSGGRQVIFNDVEVLHQESPERSSPRKRSYEEFRGISARIADLEERCGQAIEGHPTTPAVTRSRASKRFK